MPVTDLLPGFEPVTDLLPGFEPKRLRPINFEAISEDLRLMCSGTLDWRSAISGYRKQTNPVEVIVRDKNGKIKAIRRSHNTRLIVGRDNFQRLSNFGNISANASAYTGVSGSATATSGTSLTNSGAAFPTSGGPGAGGLAGQIVVCPVAGVYGVIVSNSATVLTVDQWTSMSSATGAAGSTPASTAAYAILAFAGAANWIALATDSGAPSSSDVTRSADGLWGGGTSGGAATEATANGLARAFCQATFPSASNVQLQYTWTYTGSSLLTYYKVVLFNSLAVAGTIPFLETLLSAGAPVAASGDTIQVTWSIGYNS